MDMLHGLHDLHVSSTAEQMDSSSMIVGHLRKMEASMVVLNNEVKLRCSHPAS